MRKDKENLKDSTRKQLVHYVATEIVRKPEVETRALATDFYIQNGKLHGKLLGSLAEEMIIQTLIKWIDDILNSSVAAEIARKGRTQLVLPFGLQDIHVPGALSFISGANRVKFVANYKAVGWQVGSHAFMLRKHAVEVADSSNEFERLWAAVKPMMDEDPKLTLAAALKRLADADTGAA